MKKLLWIWLILGLAIAGCTSEEVGAETPTLAEDLTILVTPYATKIPVERQAPTPTPSPTLTPPPLPTPTPFLHIVTEGETLIGIASYYGVSLEALQVANADVNPNFLSVGTQLVIPLEIEAEALSPAEPAVLPVTGGEVACNTDRGGGLWCFWEVTNSLAQPVENLAGVVHLYDREGEILLSQPAYSLLNLLRPGETFVLGTYFKPPLPDWRSAQGQITSAAAANQVGDRYLDTQVSSVNIQLGEGNELASRVSGTVLVTGLDEGVWPAYLWVVAMAFDDTGQAVGIRRWEAPEEALGDAVDFDFVVYSTGGWIARVEILAEARSSVP
ncbi:MAG: LysM peptidoglycan-binding domain-containing protein [Anaerolineales bacterium]|nr:LysM peptidoglycan-binding domain-containing protein [Anaerolineales bacterium]